MTEIKSLQHRQRAKRIERGECRRLFDIGYTSSSAPALVCSYSALVFYWISPSSVPTPYTSPAADLIVRFPDDGSSMSCADLSLSSRYSGSPALILAPSAISHSASVPSFMEKPIFGNRISVAMILSSTKIND